jgi:hypothetical protein
MWSHLRVELATEISCVERYTSRDGFVAGVQVQNAVFCLANPDDLGNLRSERGLGGVTALDIEEIPSGCSLGCCPVVAGRREKGSVLAS